MIIIVLFKCDKLVNINAYISNYDFKNMKKELIFVFMFIGVLIIINPISAKVINCGNDYNCFLNASINCEKSKVLVNESIDVFFVRFDIDTQMQIKGMKKDFCLLSMKNKKVDFVLNEEVLNAFSFGLLTHKQFIEMQRRARSQAKQYKDISGTCKLFPNQVTPFLQSWQYGYFINESSLEGYDCRGRFFSEVEISV